MKPIRTLSALLGAAALALFAQAAPGQSLPGSTLRVIVPFAPGGGADNVARLVGQQLGARSGKAIVVENRPGAGSMIGTELAARAAPDGGTVLVVGNAFIINKILRPALTYDPFTSFEPICMLVDSPGVLVVNSSSDYRTLEQFLQAARAHPGELSYGSVGPASATQLAGEMLKDAAKVDVTYAPFGGAAPALTALLGNHITAAMVLYSEVAPQLKAGTLRALAVTSRERFGALREVPTIAESGYKDYEMSIWVGVLAPGKTSKDSLAQLSGSFASALEVPDLKTKLVAQELSPGGPCGADFGSFLHKEFDKYSRVIKAANIKME